MRRLAPWTNFILFAILIGGAIWLMWWQTNRLDAGAVATLVGALLGGAALLLGNGINNMNERSLAAEALDERRAKLKTLVIGELVNVAADLLGGEQILDAALEQVSSAGGTIPLDVDPTFIRGLPLTLSLGPELLILEQPQLDALVMLQANLAITQGELREIGQKRTPLGRLQLRPLAAGVAHSMEILAQCFERIAPTRKLQMPGKEPEVASSVLKRAAERYRPQSRRNDV